jgi:hypothetical protein
MVVDLVADGVYRVLESNESREMGRRREGGLRIENGRNSLVMTDCLCQLRLREGWREEFALDKRIEDSLYTRHRGIVCMRSSAGRIDGALRHESELKCPDKSKAE